MIIDCFLFFDELDLLRIRLNELKDVVDVFVLTESTYTFTGLEKPLYFKKNADRFKDFNIAHNVCRSKINDTPMAVEKHQKQHNLDFAFDNIFKRGDTIIQGDCDEIPKASIVKDVINSNGWRSVRLSMTLFYYWLNCREVYSGRVWKNSRLLRPKRRFEYNARQNDRTDKTYMDAGWHFSWLGDVQKKLASWGHAGTYNRPPYNSPDYIKACIERGLDLVKRKGKRKIEFEFVDDLNCLPQYVLDNLEWFGKYIK